ncbi:malic protein NAD-binding protein [Coriobacterium glomerans PW2]|uniref:Malic protein NAD-binding protein n=1 Tax=Coriobacterium glomerans (strain ATCC 49209 / DSM 20642 / JCM 10262 / PW2) TaxID=700015 RepID=F2NBF0_CORGP|nr:NADP-dependent malic enzyme [Coriobacterium glomerans]AEB06686.1 malic protein NAD-binding protein [Coriobacterium glomerans PW2]
MEQDEVIAIHEAETGVLQMAPEMRVENPSDLSLAYTPGVATMSKAIERDPSLKAKMTLSGKLIAVVTDGSAVLGLGNIGPAAGLPIVEGKALLYKSLAGVDALPLAVEQVSTEEFIRTIRNISLSFAGIHLEDIAAPQCFEIETSLEQLLDIPVYHDDQEGTAIVVLAALINAAKVVGKRLSDLRVVINGVGAGGIATGRLLYAAGVRKLTLVDIDGVVRPDSPACNSYQIELAEQIGYDSGSGSLDEVISGQDVFIGLSAANVLSGRQVRRMAADPIIFALANPVPEIEPSVAREAGAAVIATGSSQHPNQVNNILAFPGLFKGLLECGLKRVDLKLEQTVARALAHMVCDPAPEHIIPGVFDEGVVETVTQAIRAYVIDQNSNHI